VAAAAICFLRIHDAGPRRRRSSFSLSARLAVSQGKGTGPECNYVRLLNQLLVVVLYHLQSFLRSLCCTESVSFGAIVQSRLNHMSRAIHSLLPKLTLPPISTLFAASYVCPFKYISCDVEAFHTTEDLVDHVQKHHPQLHGLFSATTATSSQESCPFPSPWPTMDKRSAPVAQGWFDPRTARAKVAISLVSAKAEVSCTMHVGPPIHRGLFTAPTNHSRRARRMKTNQMTH
jgi:hypothetical protein